MSKRQSADPSPNSAGTQNDQRPDGNRLLLPPPVPWHLRPYPADQLVCLALAALLYDAGRARMRELGIGPEAFEDDAARIGAVLISERDFTREETDLLWRDDEEHLPWGVAIDFTLGPEWARDIIDKFAAAFAGRWMPPVLRWAADRMERDGWCVERVAPEVDQLLMLVRPAILRAGGRAA